MPDAFVQYPWTTLIPKIYSMIIRVYLINDTSKLER